MAQIYVTQYLTPERRREIETSELREFFTTESETLKDADSVLFLPVPVQRDGPSMGFEYIPGKGFSLVWNIRDENGKFVTEMLSVSDRSTLGTRIYKDNQAVVPLGSFVPGAKAFEVLEDFARNPKVLSGAVDWIDSRDLDWPEP